MELFEALPGMARVTASVDIRFSYFVCLLIKVSDDFKSVIGKSKARSEGAAGIILYH